LAKKPPFLFQKGKASEEVDGEEMKKSKKNAGKKKKCKK